MAKGKKYAGTAGLAMPSKSGKKGGSGSVSNGGDMSKNMGPVKMTPTTHNNKKSGYNGY